MHLIFRLALPLAGWLALAGATVDIPGYPKDRKNLIPIDYLAKFTKKAPKQMIIDRILNNKIRYRFDYPVIVTDVNIVEQFFINGEYHEYDEGQSSELYRGKFVVSDGKICIYSVYDARGSYTRSNYPYPKCRSVLVDGKNNIWMQIPNAYVSEAVIADISSGN